jgi:hypothetical protein
MIVADGQIDILEIAYQCRPSSQTVFDGFGGERTMGG